MQQCTATARIVQNHNRIQICRAVPRAGASQRPVRRARAALARQNTLSVARALSLRTGQTSDNKKTSCAQVPGPVPRLARTQSTAIPVNEMLAKLCTV